MIMKKKIFLSLFILLALITITGCGSNKSNNGYNSTEAEHKKRARPSTEDKHERGQSRKNKDKGNEKGDARRKRYK